jgi:putative selenium metabolism protein SsnA
MTLVLAGATIVTSIDPVRMLHGDVIVEEGRVAAAGATPADLAGGADRIDCAGCVVMPGNACAHTHLYSALARGMPYRLDPPRDFVEILRRVWWRLDRALDEGSIHASALVGGMEALLAGTTTLVDHHASPGAIDGSLDVVADALAQVGIRGVLAYEVTDRDGPERARAGIAESLRFAGRVAAGSHPLARAMVGAHASFTLTDETLAACVDAVRQTGTGLHVHVAEDAADQDDCRARFGMRVVERLERAGALADRALLAHGVHLDEAEAELVRASGATVVHNARSNMNNAVGRADVARLGERVALGTDGIGGDMFEESRTAWFGAREGGAAGDPSWALARLAASARVAARAFGEPLLGRIERGAPADLVVLDHQAPAPLDERSFAGHWMFGMGGRSVRDVVVAGTVVVRERRLHLVGQDWVTRTALDEATRLWARLDGIAEHPFDPRTAAIR